MSLKAQSELYAGGELYVLTRHLVVSGNYPSVMGSKYVERDLHLIAYKLDPRGDAEWLREVKRRGVTDAKMCSCGTHRGSAWLPKEEFSLDRTTPDGRDRYCKGCRAELAHARRVRELAMQGKIVRDWKRQKRTLPVAV